MLAIVNVPWMHKNKSRSSYAGSLYAALDVIGSGDPKLAQAIHDSNNLPPFSASLTDGILRIGCLTTDVFLAVANSPLAYKAQREREDSFESIIEAAGEATTIKLAFVSPVALGVFGHATAMPDPRNIFASLIRRWQVADGPEVPELNYLDVPVIHASLRTHKIEIDNYAQRGWLGTIVYGVPKEQAKWFHALAKFGEYSGIGKKTTQGMGQIRYASSTIARQNEAVPA